MFEKNLIMQYYKISKKCNITACQLMTIVVNILLRIFFVDKHNIEKYVPKIDIF